MVERRGLSFGLKEGEIPLECREVAIADAYDAMTNDGLTAGLNLTRKQLKNC